MDDIVDVVIPVAMLLVSLFTAILGAKKKKARLDSRVEEIIAENEDEDESFEESVRPEPLEKVFPIVEEGVSTIPDKKAPVNEAFVQKPEEKKKGMSREEKKKLIIYSEILHPKFDA